MNITELFVQDVQIALRIYNSYSYSHTSTNSFIQYTVDCMFSEQEGGAAAHWLQHWPANCKLSGSMPMVPGCCFQGTFTPIAPINCAGCSLCIPKTLIISFHGPDC